MRTNTRRLLALPPTPSPFFSSNKALTWSYLAVTDTENLSGSETLQEIRINLVEMLKNDIARSLVKVLI